MVLITPRYPKISKISHQITEGDEYRVFLSPQIFTDIPDIPQIKDGDKHRVSITPRFPHISQISTQIKQGDRYRVLIIPRYP